MNKLTLIKTYKKLCQLQNRNGTLSQRRVRQLRKIEQKLRKLESTETLFQLYHVYSVISSSFNLLTISEVLRILTYDEVITLCPYLKQYSADDLLSSVWPLGEFLYLSPLYWEDIWEDF